MPATYKAYGTEWSCVDLLPTVVKASVAGGPDVRTNVRRWSAVCTGCGVEMWAFTALKGYGQPLAQASLIFTAGGHVQEGQNV